MKSTARSRACSISAPTPASTSRRAGGDLTVMQQNRESAGRDELRQQGRPVQAGLAEEPHPAHRRGKSMTAAAIAAPSVSLSGRLSTYFYLRPRVLLRCSCCRRCCGSASSISARCSRCWRRASSRSTISPARWSMSRRCGTLRRLFTAANLLGHLAHPRHGGARDHRQRRDRLSRSPTTWRATRAADQGAVLCRGHAAAVVQLSGAGLCLEA